jgi:hypothetical protein
MMHPAAKTDSVFSFDTPAQLLWGSGRYLTDPAPEARTYDLAPDGRFLMISLGEEHYSGSAMHRRRAELRRGAQASRAPERKMTGHQIGHVATIIRVDAHQAVSAMRGAS